MTNVSGTALELRGIDVFKTIGLNCIHAHQNVRLDSLVPTGSFHSGENMELDLLIPVGRFCLIVEMKGVSVTNKIKEEYAQFRRHFSILQGLTLTNDIWTQLGVSSEDLHLFRNVKELRGLFVLPYIKMLDIDLPRVNHITCFYQADWKLLEEYGEALGKYAKPYFLNHFETHNIVHERNLIVSHDDNRLICHYGRRISGFVDENADVFTFEISPYELLPIAHVFRRDNLPSIGRSGDSNYQRPLAKDKLFAIRNILKREKDFMFPNSVLVVLSGDCVERDSSKIHSNNILLEIPAIYGAVSIIDGQHRLFAYADDATKAFVGDNARIMVTALRFVTSDQPRVKRYSAATFVEINTTQTPVSSTLLDAIGYSILGLTDSRSLTVEVITRLNVSQGTTRGLFQTDQSNGVIQPRTIISSIKGLFDIEAIRRLLTLQTPAAIRKQNGIKNLFAVTSLEDLLDPDTLLDKGSNCLKIYFGFLQSTFNRDWTREEIHRDSSLRHTKLIAAFLRLLTQFIAEGLDWPEVRKQLEAIRSNLIVLRGWTKYEGVLLDSRVHGIPGYQPSVSEDYVFLCANRHTPTPIADPP